MKSKGELEQPKTKELEYRIIAVNKPGEGEPSNTEMVVLAVRTTRF